jgi:hypothetical protein
MRAHSGLAAAAALVLAAAGCGGSSSPTSPTSPSTSTTTSTTTTGGITGGVTTTTVTVSYVQDVRPIFVADCTRCHAGSRPDGGVDLSTYSGTMRVVTAGSANSALIRVSQSGGAMYQYFSGDRASKAALVRSWVVANNAAETR